MTAGILVACGSGGSSTGSAAVPASVHQTDQKAASSGSGTSSNGFAAPAQKGLPDNAVANGPQYLVKSLNVVMEAADTRQTASELQHWISNAAPQATSNGIDYQQDGQSQYTVTLNYLVDLNHYIAVEQYLRDYAGQNGRTLVSLQETVQDVTNDYVDTDARLTNLRTEEQRLLTFLSQSQNMTDTLNIESQLTQVEGEINDIQAHMDSLKGQTSFYNVTITIQPTGSAVSQPSPWNVVPVWQGAWNAVLTVWQGLATLLVWLAAFSVYIVPVVLLIWLLRRRPWRRMPALAAVPLSSKPTDTEKSTDSDATPI